MGRPAKRARAVTPPPALPKREDALARPAAKSPKLETSHASPPLPPPPLQKRGASKKFLPEVDDLDSSSGSNNLDATSVQSDESVRVENSQEREEALIAAGDALTGDALKNFLQTNFVDFVDEKLFEIPNLDLPDV